MSVGVHECECGGYMGVSVEVTGVHVGAHQCSPQDLLAERAALPYSKQLSS